MYAVITAVFPGVGIWSVVGYGLTVPADPQVMHRAADGWSAFANGVQAAGTTTKEQHDSVSLASWQAPERELYAQKVTSYAMASNAASDSAHSLSFWLRVAANVWTAYIYWHLLFAARGMVSVLKAMLFGPGGRLYEKMRVANQMMVAEQKVHELKKFLFWNGLFTLPKLGALWYAKHSLTDGLKNPQYEAGGTRAGTAEV
ncbi:hypothetical protein [Nonomuraea sp. NPDC049400]|uniref:hypothetical protein n=1 Tax=Nonomuraea sp. NPDC049400 TaxID=3364352 RepID=UPI0037B2ABC6